MGQQKDVTLKVKPHLLTAIHHRGQGSGVRGQGNPSHQQTITWIRTTRQQQSQQPEKVCSERDRQVETETGGEREMGGERDGWKERWVERETGGERQMGGERQVDTETGGERDRWRRVERQSERETGGERDGRREGQVERETGGESERMGDRWRERERKTGRETGKQTGHVSFLTDVAVFLLLCAN